MGNQINFGDTTKALTCIEHNHFALLGKPDTTPLITHRFSLSEIEAAYRIFENRPDGIIKVAIAADEP